MNRIANMNKQNDPTPDARVMIGRKLFATGVAALVIVVVGTFTSCATQHPPIQEQGVAPTAVTLVSGDVIKLTFAGAAELNQVQKIRTDGKVNLPLIGEVEASGKTIPTLQNELSQRYKVELKTSTVVVTLEQSVTQVVLSGSIARPGKLVFERPTTIFQAIMEAGGVNEFGSLRNVHLIRLINGQQQTQVLDLRPVTSGQPTKPYYVRDGDVIFIPRNIF